MSLTDISKFIVNSFTIWKGFVPVESVLREPPIFPWERTTEERGVDAFRVALWMGFAFGAGMGNLSLLIRTIYPFSLNSSRKALENGDFRGWREGGMRFAAGREGPCEQSVPPA